MKFMLSFKAGLLWAGSLFSILLAPGAGASGDRAAQAQPAVYSIINLGPTAQMAFLNKRGQAAFVTIRREGNLNAFFDGRRVHTLAATDGPWTMLRALNSHGVVVGDTIDRAGAAHAFQWTVASGLRPLPRAANGSAYAINDNGQVAGLIPGEAALRAIRWNADGSLTNLGPLPARISVAQAINDSGATTGFADVPSGEYRAMFWDAAGLATDMGAPPNAGVSGDYINAGSQVAGRVWREFGLAGFFWSRKDGMVPIQPDGGAWQYVAALNDNGEVAGGNQVNDGSADIRFAPFIWSRRGGMRMLPLGGAPTGEVYALTNRAQMVGFVQRTLGDRFSLRAVHWNGVSAPVDLNTRLHNAPAGLVLHNARAINEDGAILADSNAGLVLLRPGREGTSAPVLGPIAGASPDDVVHLDATVDFTASFVDSAPGETHRATARVDDACAQAAPSLTEARGSGTVAVRHTFCQPGAFTIRVKVTDRAGNATEVERRLYVVDQSVPTLVGHGALAAPGAGNTPLRVDLWAPLASPGRDGAAPAHVQASGPFQFAADAVGQPERNGQAVTLRGTGRLDGRAGYRFTLEATAGDAGRGGADRLRLRISHTDAATGAEVLDYDNGAQAASAASRSMGAPDGTRLRLMQGTLQLAERAPAR